MSKPRDIAAYERGQAHREAIRQVMLEHVRHHSLRKPLSGKQAQSRLWELGINLRLSTVLLYMSEIHSAAEAEASRDLVLESF